MHLVISKLGPKASYGLFSGGSRMQGVVFPNLINVLKDGEELSQWFAMAENNRDLLVGRLGLRSEGLLFLRSSMNSYSTPLSFSAH